MIGQTISHYRIVDRLGQGGMGVVYKAEDTKLDRFVALKFLPPESTRDPDAKTRFIREAKAASTLQHNNICTLHDIDETADGQSFIVMDHYEGETLKTKIERGPLKIEESLNIAIQIAQGLEEAHKHQIIHRDIKPANVLISTGGVVKILDFGLAKLVGQTVLTQTGAAMGTAAYMSPEQSWGETLDGRADIWSLGVVMYEMVTGQRPFKGEYDALMFSIANAQPEPLTALRTGVPMELEWIVQKCLSKIPAERYQHIDELLVDLRSCSKGSSQRGSQPQLAAKPLRRSRKILWYVGGAAIVVLSLMVYVQFEKRPVRQNRIHFTFAPEGLSIFGNIALSPDGTRLLFVAKDSTAKTQIYLWPLNSLSAQPLAGTADASRPFWSPDGDRIAFRQGGLLKIVDAKGGSPVTFGSGDSFGAAWNREDVILLGIGLNSIRRVAAKGGAVVPVLPLDTANGEKRQVQPTFLPDGEHFLYVSGPVARPKSGLYLGSLDGKTREYIGKILNRVEYLQTGHLMYPRYASLLLQSFDLSSRTLANDPIPIARVAVTRFGDAEFTISQNGILAYIEPDPPSSRLIWFDRKGNQIGVLGDIGRYGQIALSPDQTRLAVEIGGDDPALQDIWIAELARGVFTRFTSDLAFEVIPAWSADSKSLFFSTERLNPTFSIVRKGTDGDTEEKLFFERAWRTVGGVTHASPDGKFVVMGYSLPKESGLWVLPVSGEGNPINVVKGSSSGGRISPDCRWIAYFSSESGRSEVYVQPFMAKGERVQVSLKGGESPRWRQDGKELFYMASDGTIMSVSVRSGKTFEIAGYSSLFRVGLDEVRRIRTGLTDVRPETYPYDVTARGDRFIVNISKPAERLIHVVVHWDEALEKK